MIDMTISVSATQSDITGKEDSINYTVFGKYLFYESDIRLSYYEPESGDMGKTKTHIRITEDCVIIRREGSVSSKITLKEGENIPFIYKTPFGTIEMAAEARSIFKELTSCGGSLTLDYDMFVEGKKTTRNRLLLKISKM